MYVGIHPEFLGAYVVHSFFFSVASSIIIMLYESTTGNQFLLEDIWVIPVWAIMNEGIATNQKLSHFVFYQQYVKISLTVLYIMSLECQEYLGFHAWY